MNVLLIRPFISLFVFVLLFPHFVYMSSAYFYSAPSWETWIPEIVCIFYLPFTKHVLPESGRCVEMNKSSAFEQIVHGSVEIYRTEISNYTNFYDGVRMKKTSVPLWWHDEYWKKVTWSNLMPLTLPYLVIVVHPLRYCSMKHRTYRSP
jgi:hypothetical protein